MTTVAPTAAPVAAPAASPAPADAPALAADAPPMPEAPTPPAGAADEGYDHPGLNPDIAAARLQAGREAEYSFGTPDDGAVKAGAPAYFQTYEQVATELRSLAEQYPDLVSIADVGDGSEKARGGANRDVLSITLSNKKSDAPNKPSALWIAGEHAREIANPAMMMRWIRQKLSGYGTDPEATALLDTRSVTIVPMMNVDGHAVVERGYSTNNSRDLWQRKNTSPPAGTDLNRNYDFRWGGPGAGSSPSSETYRGPSAASEPETRAIQELAKATKPGMFIDWHSYSELVLFPWGDTRDKAPDHEGLNNVANRFARYNHYSPKQAINLYPTSGTSIDYTYGQLKIPSFVIETGRSFHMDDRAYEQVWAANAPVMDYSAKIADDPYSRVKGPDALDVMVDPASKTLAATVSDALAGAKVIKAAEAVVDPFSAFGTGVQLRPADGQFDGKDERVVGDVSGLFDAAEGARKLVYVRAQDVEGNWGPATPQWLSHPSFGPGAAADAPAAAPTEPATEPVPGEYLG